MCTPCGRSYREIFMLVKFSRPRLRELIVFIMMGALVAVDQLTKLLADTHLVMGAPSVKAIPCILNFRLLYNDGMAFGLLANHRYIFISITCVIVAAGIVLLAFRAIESNYLVFSAALIVAGGIGNLIDRFFVGYVVDFFEFDFIEFSIFNIADCCVVIGAGLLIIYFLADTAREHRQKRAKNAAQSAGESETAAPPEERT